jgi:hypothetical protein
MDKQMRLLAAARRLKDKGKMEYSGFELYYEDLNGRRFWHGLGFGTVYSTLEKLEQRGMFTSRWEDPAAFEGPRRRLYSLTALGNDEAMSYVVRS